MINSELRAELAQDIRRLATGRMTNDEFDDRYYEVYEPSDDRAIHAIARFCYGLYSSDLLLPIRLRGRYALDRETKKAVARCVLFLRTGNEYGWPAFPDALSSRCLAGLAFSLGFPAGVALALIAIALVLVDPQPLAFQLLGIGLALAAACFWFGYLRPTVSKEEWQRYTGTGDFDCWPFLQRESFESARRRVHPLSD